MLAFLLMQLLIREGAPDHQVECTLYCALKSMKAHMYPYNQISSLNDSARPP